MELSDFEFKTKPFDHQADILLVSAAREYYAIFGEQGTGKTKVLIDTAAYLYSQDLIDTVVVLAPNGVHRNWVVNEIPEHMPDYVNCRAHYYQAGAGKKQQAAWQAVFKHAGLRVFCFNIEAASNKAGQHELRLCVTTGRVLFIIDESQCIKTPGAKRTLFLINLGHHAEFRRISTGTPLTQGPLDFYAQFKFLDPYITGYTTAAAFRNHFAEYETVQLKQLGKNGETRTFEKLVGYKNIDELERKVAPHCYRILKKDCLDLPDKLYEKVYVELTPEQKRIYKQLLDKSVAVLKEEFAGEIPAELRGADNEQLLLFFATSKITAKNAMTKMLRLQQVICGSLPDDNGAVTTLANNRLRVLGELVESISGKVIIWARFRNDLQAISDLLREKYGPDSVAEYHGGIGNNERMEGVERFQKGAAQFFVSQQHSGGTGLTLTAASHTIYYSNDFSLEARLQSEDRNHRIGQKNNVTYYDMIAVDTVDEKILKALMDKKEIADGFDYDGKSLPRNEQELKIYEENNNDEEPAVMSVLNSINFEEDAQ